MSIIARELSKAIKENKWLYVEYQREDDSDSKFWIAIQDIDISKKKITATFFNESKTDRIVKNGQLFFDKILFAEVVDGTTYKVPNELFDKIESNIHDLDWMQYDQFDDNIISYYAECAKYDQDPFQKDKILIDGIDEHSFESEGELKLNRQQGAQLLDFLEKQRKGKHSPYNFVFEELAVNSLAIDVRGKGLFVVAYKQLLFNPEFEVLILDNRLHINHNFLVNEIKFSLNHYLEVEIEDFKNNLQEHFSEYKKMIHEALKYPYEKIDTIPHFMVIARNPSINYEQELLSIKEAHDAKKLTTPIKAFFGDMSTRNLGKSENFDLYLLDDKVNIDQLRVIYNAFKNPVTYVQGPPGTGKTQTIVNLIVAAFYNSSQQSDYSILISSNNNKPIDGIYQKLEKLIYLNNKVPFPMIRLGNREYIGKTLTQIKNSYETFKDHTIYEDTLNRQKNQKKVEHSEINNLLQRYEKKQKLNEQLMILKDLRQHVASLETGNTSLVDAQISSIETEISELGSTQDKDALVFLHNEDSSMIKWLYYASIARIKKLGEPKFERLLEILDIEDEEEKINKFNQYIKDDTNLRQFIKVFPFIATTNLSSIRLGSPLPHFDLVIIDEAGQCSITNALLPMLRGEKLLLVGDQNQLEPVITIDPNLNRKLMDRYHIPESYNYMNNSILRLMLTVDRISKYILLRYHYRSHKKIVDFSNKKYYGGNLIVETNYPDDDILNFVNIKSFGNQPIKNTSHEEVQAILSILKENDFKDVGIITPFRNQAEFIKENVQKYGFNNVEIGTIHTFQGDEKDVIIVSTSITPASSGKTYDWIKNNRELINVATTRPKRKLIVLADNGEIERRSNSDDDYKQLIDYIVSNGKNEITPNSDKLFVLNVDGRKRINSTHEEDFLFTISHFITTDKRYIVKDKIKVSSVASLRKTEHEEYYLKAEFDFVLINVYTKLVELAIELDGPEHYIDTQVRFRDYIKKEICDLNNIKLLRIKNDYARDYETIRDKLVELLL